MEKVKKQNFNDKWRGIINEDNSRDEDSIFVELGKKPITQRQFNLFHYFEFIKSISLENNCHNVLEIGCGRGTISLYLNKYLHCNVSMADTSEEAIKLAKYNFSRFNGTGTFLVADAENLKFSDNSFDMVVSIGLAEHFKDYTKLFMEQYRVLRPGGIMISLNIPQKSSIQVINDLYRLFLKLSKQELKSDYFRNSDKPDDYRACAKRIGFEDISVFYVNPFPLLTPVNRRNEKIITIFYRIIYCVRSLFIKYPFKGSRLLSQAHFLIAKK